MQPVSRKKNERPVEMGPLGPGHAPKNDPMKGLRGVMAGTHIMEAITILLGLTVVARVDGGDLATPFNLSYVIGLGVLMIIAAFLQKAKFADGMNIGLQVLAILGVIVHVSIGVVGVLFAAVWWYIYTLKRNMVLRMKRGLLPSQHID